MWSWLVSLFLLWCIKVWLPLLSYSHKKYLSLPFQTYVVPITGYFLLMKLPLFAFCRSTLLQVIHILGNFMRIWSVYSLYSYLSNSGDSIVGFIFSCLVPASVIFLVLQKPWKGRPLPNSQVLWYLHVLEIASTAIRWPFSLYLFSCVLFQVVPTVVNGGILALYFVLWGKGLLACGPLM